jgi:Ca2+-binding RTX toxin-like protein
LSTDDPDVGQTHTYAINGGTGASRFEIVNGDEIRVKSGALLDFEGTDSYTLVITATDNGILPLTFSEELTIGLTDANDLPVAVTDTGATNLAFRMSEDDGTKAFDVRSNDSLDPDAGALNNITIDSGSISVQSNMLGIDASDLNVSVNGSNNVEVQLIGIDWHKLAQNQTLDITIPYMLHGDQVSDASAANLTVRVTGVNDGPINLVISSDQVPENIPGVIIGALSVDDADTGDTVTFTIQAGPDSSLFTIVGDELRVGNLGLDFEAAATRTVTVRATDSHGAFFDQLFVVHVSDSEEVTLTTAADTLLGSSTNIQLTGNALTLNPGDNLDGGDGSDSLVLFGGGTFDLNGLAGFANFEGVQVVNFTMTPVTLTLRDGTTSDVAINGIAFTTQINLLGTTSAGSILGGDGTDSVSLSGNTSATTINLGNGNGQSVTLSDDASAGSILGGTGTDSVSLSGNTSATTINLGNGNGQSVTFSDDASAGSIVGGDGRDNVTLSGNASATIINVGNAPGQTQQSIGLFDAASATIIQGGSGRESVQLSSSGSVNVTTINLGDNSDSVSVANASSWNSGIAIDGGSGSDTLALSGSNQTYDLQPTTLTGIETLSLTGDNETVLVDGDALTGVTTISGGSTNKIVTGQAALDLTGKSVSGVTIQSSNATGTTFTVDNKTTAFQVLGGLGADTLETTSFAFTALERQAIFNTSSIELIHDTSGLYGNETNNTLTGTASADNIQGGGGDDRLTGDGGTDSLAGGADSDTFVFNFPSEGMDTIGDFVSGTDRLEISAAGFGGGLTAGTDPATVFGSSSNADFTSTERFHLDTSSDTLYFDADGSGGMATAVAIAQFPNQAVLQPSDWVFV